MDEWYMWQVFFTTGSVLDYIRYKSIQDAKANLKYCSQCYNITDTDPCPICSNVSRNKELICVVEDV
ncbi:MAG: hypothetical protein II517_02945, partial [Ruminococcus sp.]|nr:hypothetical protein [Ruminococcus sp.]